MNPTVIASGSSTETPVALPSQPRSSSGGPKKGIIIGAILIVLALGLAVAAILLMPKGGGNKKTDSLSAADTYVQLYNYMIYGNVDGGDERNDAYFEEIATSESLDVQNEFFDKTDEYVGALKEKVSGETLKNTNKFATGMTVSREVSSVAYTDILQREYLAGGSNNLKQHLEKNQEMDFGDNSLFSTAVGVVEKDLIEKSNELYVAYQNAGCIVEKTFDIECMDRVTENEAATNLLGEVSSARIKLRGYAESIVSRVLNLLDEIGEAMK